MHAELLQAIDLLLGQDADGRGDVDVDLCLDGGDGLGHLVHQVLVGALHCGDDAELRGAGLGGLLRGLDQLGDVQLDGADRGFEKARLGAEVAVLGAAAGLQGNNALHLHGIAAPL